MIKLHIFRDSLDLLNYINNVTDCLSKSTFSCRIVHTNGDEEICRTITTYRNTRGIKFDEIIYENWDLFQEVDTTIFSGNFNQTILRSFKSIKDIDLLKKEIVDLRNELAHLKFKIKSYEEYLNELVNITNIYISNKTNEN